MSHNFKLTMIAAFLAIVGLSRTSQAQTAIANGSTLGGWTISWNPGIAISFTVANGTIDVLQKTSTVNINTGFLITFVQSGTTGVAPKIQFSSKSITNSSGTTWVAFESELLTSSGTPATFEGPAGIFVPPTTGPGVNYTSDIFTPTDIVYFGTQINGSTAQWGANGGAMTIDTNPTSSGPPAVFSLKEIPTVAVVPLPAAVWQGLSGLLGLGLIGYAKKLKKVLA